MKICAIILGRIGDMILSTAAFKLIKEKYPDAELTVIASRHNKIIIENNDNIDNIIVYEKSPVKVAKFLLELNKQKFDYYIDPKDHRSKESKYIAGIVNAATKIYFNPKNKYSTSFKNKNIQHFTDLFIYALRHLDIELLDQTPKPILKEKSSSTDYSNEFIQKHQLDNFIIYNISANSAARVFKAEKNINILNEIDSKDPVVLIYSQKDKEKAYEIITSTKNVIGFNSRNLHDVASIIKRSALVITPDTSIVHIAAAFNKPLLAFYSGNIKNYKKFEPLSDIHISIKAEKDDETIENIEIERINEGFEKLTNNIN